jgi:hypothetical protein
VFPLLPELKKYVHLQLFVQMSTDLNLTRRLASAFLISVTLFALSCDYETDEVYYKEIARPDWSDISIDLATLSSDTIYISQTTQLNFDALIGQHKIRGAYAYLGDRLVHTSGEGLFPIVIETEYIPSGTYKLHLEVTLTSGTGSLADLREQELTKVTRDWIVIIDHDVPEKIHITSIEKVDGRLAISWEPYVNWNFQHYTLTKYCYNEFYKYFEHCWTNEIFSQTTTSILDSSFIGGKANYILSIRAANHNSESDEELIEFDYDPALQFEWADNQTLQLSWRRPEFYNSMGSYKIYFPNDVDSRSFNITDVNDTTLQIEGLMKFPAYKQLAVSVTPKKANDYNKGDRISFQFAIIGKYFPWFEGESLTYNSMLKKYFAISYIEFQKSLVSIDPVTLEIERSFPSDEGMFAVSENGEHLYVADNDKLFRLDPMDFTVKEEIDFPVNSSYYKYMKVSNNKRLVVENEVWDLNTGTMIQTMPTGAYAISPNGEFAFGFGKLYRYNVSTFQEVTQLGTLGSWGEFTTDNRFLSYPGGTIKVFDLSTMSLESAIPCEASYLHLDPATGLIGGFTDDFEQGPKKFYVFSTSGLQKEINIANISTQYSYMLLVNDNLVCSSGNIVPVSWYE